MNAARAITWLAGAFLAASLLALQAYEGGMARQPIYIGSLACAQCHDTAESGHQFSRWLRSAHARAFAVLALPQAQEIAELSGVPEPPPQAATCLGCHSTAAEAEDWERVEGFRFEDGLQCEKCHGPGSEYAVEDIMRDRRQAMAHGLLMPKRESCRVCHRQKGSHSAVLQKEPFDLNRAWDEISHLIPDSKGSVEVAQSRPADAQPGASGSSPSVVFAGVTRCIDCHSGAKAGFQFSLWRMSRHAQAYATLATDRAYDIARQEGVDEEPQHSRECLRCHTTGADTAEASFLSTFHIQDGVQCESCHGPSSEHAADATGPEPPAQWASLPAVTEETCRRCHDQAHGLSFDFASAVSEIAHLCRPVVHETDSRVRYKNPVNLALSPDGFELWIACESSDSLVVVDLKAKTKLAEVPVGRQPHDVAFEPSGRRVFVSNRLDDTVSVIDTRNREVIATLPVGDEPHGLLVEQQAELLYVLNTGSDSITVIDLQSLRTVKQLTAGRAPWSLARSPDGRVIAVTSSLPLLGAYRTSPQSEVTLIDTGRALVENRPIVSDANLLQGVAWHPSGEFALVTLLRTKNLVPMTRLIRNWVISNGLGIVWRDGTVDQVLLDQPDVSFPDPADVTITPDGRYALVTSSTSQRIAVVDLDRLIARVQESTPEHRRRILPNHLGYPTEFVVQFIETSDSPRGLVCSSDGRFVYVAQTLADSIGVIDLETMELIDEIGLGGPKEITQARWGEKLFHSAAITFRRQFSCHSCHPDGHIDGITYDIEADGLGISPVDNRTLRGVNDLAPYKWEGTNPSLQRQCGARLAVFFTRIQPFTPVELEALEYYICTIPRPPNRYRRLGDPLTPAQSRGRALFGRQYTNDGRLIKVSERCATCHSPPLYTDGQSHDVGTKSPLDRQGTFDTPHLNNIYGSAPYLHDGKALTLEEIWTRFNDDDQHGVTNDMTKDQLNDLIEYLKTL